MSNGSSRWIGTLVALVIGGILGWLVRGSAPPTPGPQVTSGSNSILVGPAAKQLTIPRLEISKKDHDVVWWNSRDADKVLYVEFETEIFKNMKPGKYGKFRVRCERASCYSDAILDNAPEKEHKYWQVLADPSGVSADDKEDGWIVIQK